MITFDGGPRKVLLVGSSSASDMQPESPSILGCVLRMIDALRTQFALPIETERVPEVRDVRDVRNFPDASAWFFSPGVAAEFPTQGPAGARVGARAYLTHDAASLSSRLVFPDEDTMSMSSSGDFLETTLHARASLEAALRCAATWSRESFGGNLSWISGEWPGIESFALDVAAKELPGLRVVPLSEHSTLLHGPERVTVGLARTTHVLAELWHTSGWVSWVEGKSDEAATGVAKTAAIVAQPSLSRLGPALTLALLLERLGFFREAQVIDRLAVEGFRRLGDSETALHLTHQIVEGILS